MTNPLRGPRVVAFQLPPRWDGRRVDWRGWESIHAHVCPPTRIAPCEGCGHVAAQPFNHGLLYPLPGETITQPLYKRTHPKKNGRPGTLYQAGEHDVPVKPAYLLTAYRCPNCQLDTVWDKRTDEWWVLDESDYGPAGSDDPRLF